MDTFRDLIARWPSVAEFGREIGVAYQTARKMNDRNSIRNAYWPAVIVAAKQRGIRGVSIEALARMSIGRGERKKSSRSVDHPAAA